MNDETKKAYRSVAGYTQLAIQKAISALQGNLEDEIMADMADIFAKRIKELTEIAELIEKDLENTGY